MCRVSVAFAVMVSGVAAPCAPASRGLQIGAPRRVFGDGRHNAFTDLARFRGAFYLVFRNAPRHGVDTRSAIAVLRSEDGARWKEVARLRLAGVDVRDPKLAAGPDRLAIISPAWRDGPFPDRRCTVVAKSGDGVHWSPFRPVLERYILWRPRRHAGRWYAAGYFARVHTAEAHVVLFRSEDALAWEKVTRIHAGGEVSETSLVFLPDGRLVAYLRGGRPDQSFHAVAREPFDRFAVRPFAASVQGPLVVPLGGRLLGAFRRYEGKSRRTALYWLEGPRMTPIAELPSGGDTSYAGFVRTGPGAGLLSYYSSARDGRPVEDPSAPADIFVVPIRWSEAGPQRLGRGDGQHAQSSMTQGLPVLWL